MAYKIEEIEGIGPAYAEKLAAAGITNTDDLLNKCCTPAGRKAVAEATGVGEVDHPEVDQHGRPDADLRHRPPVLRAAQGRRRGHHQGTAQPQRRQPGRKMKEVNDEKKLAQVSPPEPPLTKWVEAAKKMDPKLTY